MNLNLSKESLVKYLLAALICFGMPAAQIQAQNSAEQLKALSSNPKLSYSQTLLKPFAEGQQTIKVVVSLKPTQAAVELSRESLKSKNNTQLNQDAAQEYGNVYYDLQDDAVKQALENTVQEKLSSFINDIESAQANVSASSSSTVKPIVITNQFKYVFGFAAEVTLDGLQKLLADNEVVLIEEDLVLHPQLNQGIPLMNGSTARTTYNGTGVSVAIVDTGIDTSHPRLDGGKVLGGYDFGDDDPNFNPTATGSAHGTAVAGIVAGDLGSVGDYIGGVAPGAKLYGLKISPGDTGSASSADMVDAWEWALDHKNDSPANPILVVNTSFGGGRHFSSCDTVNSAMTQAALNGVNAGITHMVSSGNDGYCDSMGWPACISHVNSIGAVYDANVGLPGFCVSTSSCLPTTPNPGCGPGTGAFFETSTFGDKVTAYSNSDTNLAFFASSNNATTTDISGAGGYSGGDYAPAFGGTSAASPYAAGAAAVLQHAAFVNTGNYLTPAQVKSIFAATGDNVTDTKVAITKPRINLGNAVASITVPPATTPAMSNAAQACKPANLTQALALGLGWSQLGITNNSAIGGGSFFIVCPLIVDAAEEPLNFFNIEVQYLSPSAPSISCFIYQVDVGNGPGMVENVQTIQSASIANPGAGAYPVGVSTNITPLGFSYSNGDDALSIVCAMHPQTRIGHFGVNGM